VHYSLLLHSLIYLIYLSSLHDSLLFFFFFFFNDTATTEIYTLSLHDALPIYTSDFTQYSLSSRWRPFGMRVASWTHTSDSVAMRSEEHTSELQSLTNLVCRLLLEKKKTIKSHIIHTDFVN